MTAVTPLPFRPLLTPREAAELLGVSVKTLTRLPIPFVPASAGTRHIHRRYDPDDLRAWIERRRVG